MNGFVLLVLSSAFGARPPRPADTRCDGRPSTPFWTALTVGRIEYLSWQGCRMKKVRVAQRFALAGFLISTLFFLFWELDDRFNFFHLPTMETAPPSYTEPVLRSLLVKLNFVFCPPFVLTSFAGMDLGARANLILWFISLVLNTVLYFIVGLAVAAGWNELARFRKAPES